MLFPLKSNIADSLGHMGQDTCPSCLRRDGIVNSREVVTSSPGTVEVSHLPKAPVNGTLESPIHSSLATPEQGPTNKAPDTSKMAELYRMKCDVPAMCVRIPPDSKTEGPCGL